MNEGSQITLEEAKVNLHAWRGAELALATSTSYSIAGRNLTRTDMTTVQMMIRKYSGIVDQLSGVRRSRTRTITPIDL